ncbi:hypothetical protein TNCT_632931 [Trichonephila clavata]|uniref:Integrase p58-like C-terminal domain-containing protein n=1 Tax=Trichonephila clavata TaxID=2740835 RepID=A0A8X6FE00_TRICU|nr:hypothetical protein TNCT_632931 [Trichonephila clavata]
MPSERLSGTLNPNKCHFAAREIKVLGHLVSGNGVRPNPDKVKAVSSFPIPKNVRDIRSFLDFAHTSEDLLKVLGRLSDVTYEEQEFDPVSRRRTPKDVVHVLHTIYIYPPYHYPTKQIETEDNQSQDIVLPKGKTNTSDDYKRTSDTFQNENLNDNGTLSFY